MGGRLEAELVGAGALGLGEALFLRVGGLGNAIGRRWIAAAGREEKQADADEREGMEAHGHRRGVRVEDRRSASGGLLTGWSVRYQAIVIPAGRPIWIVEISMVLVGWKGSEQ